MADKVSKAFWTILKREVQLIHREIVDGCNDCKGLYDMCPNHQRILDMVCAKPQKYIEITKDPEGKLSTKRLFDLTNIEGGCTPIKLIL